jgi:hypothetical protein
MKSGFRPLAVLLAVLGIVDLAMVPVMINANNPPPMAATILSGVLGVVTLVSIPGLAQGRRWALWVAVISRVLDAVSCVLGAVGGPAAGFKVAGVIGLILSIAAIVLLVRVSPRRAVRAASGA